MKRIKKVPLQTDPNKWRGHYLGDRFAVAQALRKKWEAILKTPGGLEAAKKVGIESHGVGLPCKPGKVWHHLDIYDGPNAGYPVVIDLETGKILQPS